MTTLEWHPRTIIIEQRGFLSWRWKVMEIEGGFPYTVQTGSCMTQKRALRRARRYREATVVENT